MKRGAGGRGDFDSPQKKRMRDHSHRIRMLIPSRIAGSIIGKGGSNITQMRSEFNASISVPDCPGPERVISIAADDQDTTFNVLKKVLTIIEDPSNKDTNRGGHSSGEKIEVRFLFHQSQVGCIIGKAGAKIKELRQATNAQIKVYGICCPNSSDRTVAVSGNNETVINALNAILFALSNDTQNRNTGDDQYEYDPHNYDESLSFEYGGYADSRGGGNFGGGGGRPMGPGGPGRFMGNSMGGRGGGGGGSRGGRGGGVGGRGARGGGGGGGRGGGNQGRHDDYNPNNFGDEDAETTQVTIPNEYAGAIIGKGGSRIRRIRAESCANIVIEEALPGQSDRIITITGAPGQIRMAQFLLQKSVKEHGTKGQFFD